MTAEKPPLTPPDYTQCQAERREGSFMTLGPRRLVRCTNPPVWLATERAPGRDGRIGSMTLCEACKDVLLEKLGAGYAELTALAPAATEAP